MTIVRVSYDIDVNDEVFLDFYGSLNEETKEEVERLQLNRLVESFIICQDILRKETDKSFELETIGLELIDSYSTISPIIEDIDEL